VSRTLVMKLGGASALRAAGHVAACARDGQVIVVHGGGPQITALMRRRGVEPRFEGGRRVTDAATMACVVAGAHQISGELCAAFAAEGLAPEPMLGSTLRARHLPRLGLVGDPAWADAAALGEALAAGRVPLIAPLATDASDGVLLNVNADDVAACVAAAVGADELVFVTDVAGVLDDAGELIPRIELSGGIPSSARGGMLPKLEACAAAVRAGVGEVRIGLAGTVIAP
jgi:acetylglutamate kinase